METSIGERIARARSAQGMTQTELAECCELSPTQISRYEGGRASPRSATVGKIAAALNVPFDWLWAGDGVDPVATKAYELMEVQLPPKIMERLRQQARSAGIALDEFVAEKAIRLLSEDLRKAGLLHDHDKDKP